MSVLFFLAFSIVIPASLLIAAVVNDYRARRRPTRSSEGF
jgi:hypothetical protein